MFFDKRGNTVLKLVVTSLLSKLHIAKAICIDIAIINVAFILSLWLITGLHELHLNYPRVWGPIVGITLIALLVMLKRGVYYVNVRYIGMFDFLNLAFIWAGLALPILWAERTFQITGHTNGMLLLPILFPLICSGLLASVRVAAKVRHTKASHSKSNNTKEAKVLIVGAGDSGELIVREFAKGLSRHQSIIGLVDDDIYKRNLRIHGKPVLGGCEDIPALVESYQIDEILIACPSASGAQIRRIFNYCSSTLAKVKTLPSLNALVHGQPMTTNLREIQIDDLLRREPVRTNLSEITAYLGGERILITGGGGSIGSELARQIAGMSPACIILVGKGENSIYEIEQELLTVSHVKPISIIADVRDPAMMEQIFQAHQPTIVFHAAAHKHVPLMESNPCEAIKNNVGGTLNLSTLSISYGIKRFILISTDKAVNPSSVMGATKRICEMLVSGFGQNTETSFSVVRFGNVLGSRGSLIPLLKNQIRRGGPVTLTHKEMTRYFMTIPEAVSLVLQAGALGRAGEIFLLDMGEPMRIEDLALELIRLHGLMPGDDIEVRYIGVRPGEKLHEELLYKQEDLLPTTHPKIKVVGNMPTIEMQILRKQVEALIEVCATSDTVALKRRLIEMAWGTYDVKPNILEKETISPKGTLYTS